MVTVYLVRHAQSVMNTHRFLVGGRSNHTPLTQRGRQQATLCGQALRTQGVRPQALYVSPAVRTQQTAQLLRAGLGVDIPMYTDDRLQELSQATELANVSLTQLECNGPARRDVRVVAVGKAMI